MSEHLKIELCFSSEGRTILRGTMNRYSSSDIEELVNVGKALDELALTGTTVVVSNDTFHSLFENNVTQLTEVALVHELSQRYAEVFCPILSFYNIYTLVASDPGRGGRRVGTVVRNEKIGEEGEEYSLIEFKEHEYARFEGLKPLKIEPIHSQGAHTCLEIKGASSSDFHISGDLIDICKMVDGLDLTHGHTVAVAGYALGYDNLVAVTLAHKLARYYTEVLYPMRGNSQKGLGFEDAGYVVVISDPAKDGRPVGTIVPTEEIGMSPEYPRVSCEQ